MAEPDGEDRLSGAPRHLIAAAVFITGGAIMVVELLGVRLISPIYGTGLYVWAALISVALAALSLGYFAGGRLADLRPRPRPFFLIVGGSGVLVLLIPAYAPALIPAFEPAGLRGGALLAATVTFLPPLFLMACATPFAVRLSVLGLKEVGRTAGRLYAVSTLGSVAGTLATGFLLAPVLRIDLTLRLVGILLVATGLFGLLIDRQRKAALGTAAAALAALATALLPGPGPGPLGEPVFAADTPFQRVEVFDRGEERWLLLDGCVHTRMRLGDRAWDNRSYLRLFEYLTTYRRDARSLLILGLGGGALIPMLESEAYEITAVELDPVVRGVAVDYFGTVHDPEDVVVEDIRPFVRRATRTWDLVALDVVGSDRMPEHLVTREFFAEAKRVLSPGGVLALNSIGEQRGPVFSALKATLLTAFKHVDAYAMYPRERITNVVFYASDGPLELPWQDEEAGAACRMTIESGEVLTDQRNPLNHWNAGIARKIRETWLERY